MPRRINAAPIRLAELEEVDQRLALAHGYLRQLLATNSPYAEQLTPEVRKELQTTHDHIAVALADIRLFRFRVKETN
jgi:hypothetical protein